jgi:malonyl CoA-acyl carrier protein transacylase
MKTFLFPGQGSQSRGMGGSLFDEFADLTLSADQILGYSIKELCLEDPRGELNKTQFTQPGLFVVNALSYFKRVREGGEKPDYLAGHSLGEFNALLAAECFDFEVGLRLVHKRGQLMSQVRNGGMAAVVNATKEQIESILASNGLTNIDIANYNTPSQIVISGLLEEMGRAQPLFQQGKTLYYPLNTSGAFHSRFMQDAQVEFERYLNSFTFSPPSIPVIANLTARPYEGDKVAWTLARQITGTVRWSESIAYLMDMASAVSTEMQFEEVGHGNVLTKLVKNIKRHAAKPDPAAPSDMLHRGIE